MADHERERFRESDVLESIRNILRTQNQLLAILAARFPTDLASSGSLLVQTPDYDRRVLEEILVTLRTIRDEMREGR